LPRPYSDRKPLLKEGKTEPPLAKADNNEDILMLYKTELLFTLLREVQETVGVFVGG